MDASFSTRQYCGQARVPAEEAAEVAADLLHELETFAALIFPAEGQVVADQIAVDEELDVVVVEGVSRRGIVDQGVVGHGHGEVQVGVGVHGVHGEAQVFYARVLYAGDDARGIVRVEEVDVDRHGISVLSGADLPVHYRRTGRRIGRYRAGGIRQLSGRYRGCEGGLDGAAVSVVGCHGDVSTACGHRRHSEYAPDGAGYD